MKHHFYAFDMTKAIDRVGDMCYTCASHRNLPQPLLNQTTNDPPAVVGNSFAADVFRRSKLNNSFLSFEIPRPLLSLPVSFRTKRLPPSATLYPLYPSHSTLPTAPLPTIRVDPSPSFRALKNEPALLTLGITLEIDRVKNINKNPVAEKAVAEVGEKLH